MTSVRWDGAGDVAASHHATISTEQAAEYGLTRAVIRRARTKGIVDAPAPGVITFNGASSTWRQQVAVATMTGGGNSVASCRTAAALHRLDGFDEGFVEVTGARGTKVRLKGAIVHQVSSPIPRVDLVEIDGIRCTSLARTLVDVAAVVDARSVERALDDFERRGFSLTWLEQVATRLHRPGQRGTEVVLAQVRSRRQRGRVRGSWFDKLIEECIASKTLPAVVRQHDVRSAAGEFICCVDLAMPEVRLAIECHSRAFHTGAHAELVDQRREKRAMLEGWQFLYLGWADRKTPRQARQFLERLVTRRVHDLALVPRAR